MSGCVKCNDPCREKVPACSCPIKLNSICVLYDGKNLGVLNVKKGDNLTEILIKINDLISQGGSDEHINVGEGAKIYRGLNLLNQVEIKSIVSDDGSIHVTEKDNEISIEVRQEEYTDVPRYIVNNLYSGDLEEGTYSRPFKTIQAALDAFMGLGTQDNPDNSNATIIIQKGLSYIFAGNFTYRNLNIVLEEGTVINHQPSAGSRIVDYDSLTDVKASLNIELRRNSILRLYENGFRNKGSLGGAAQRKNITLSGSGKVELVGNKATGYTLFEANYNNDPGYGMPSNQNFNVDGVYIYSASKDVWNVGANTALIFNGCNIRHSNTGVVIDESSKSFDQNGGIVTLNNCTLSVNGVSRDKCFTLYKTPDTDCSLILDKCILAYPGAIGSLFFRESEDNPRVDCQYMSTTKNLNLNYVFGIYDKIPWRDIYFNYNIIKGGELSDTSSGIPMADLTNNNTLSVSNNIRGVEITTLTSFNSRTSAKNVLGSGALYILTTSIEGEETIDITI